MSCSECTQQIFCVPEDTTVVLLARLKMTDGSYIQQSDVNSIRIEIWDISDAENPTRVRPENDSDEPEDLDIGDSIFNELQTGDDRWQKDSVGFNFQTKVSFDDADHDYRVDVVLTMGNEDVIKVKWFARAN